MNGDSGFKILPDGSAEENITKAANLLHLTQPTLSRQLIQLEEELGVTLFQRSRHHIVLTEDGMLLRRRAEEILALAEKTKEDFRHNREQLSGTVAIGSGELQSSRFLARLITSFQKEHSQVSFSIYSGNSDNIKERIEHGLLDLGLLQEPVDVGKYSFIRIPIPEKFGVLIGKIRLWQKRKAFPQGIWPRCRSLCLNEKIYKMNC